MYIRTSRYSVFSSLIINYNCYNLKLSLGCNSDKDLSKSRKNNQLVKCKDIGLYLLLYIPINYEEYVKHSWENNDKEMRKIWEGLHYYMRYWLILHKDRAKYS